MKKKRILALFLAAVSCLSLAVSASAAGTTTRKATDFKDYDRTAWYAEAVSAAVDNGLLYGKSSTIIDPNGDMTRAEMAAIINRSFGCYKTADISQYKDVSKSKWYYKDVALAVQMGTYNGRSSSAMAPDSPITRQEAMTVVARALELDYDAYAKTDLSAFSDRSEISNWALPYVRAMVGADYIHGRGKVLAPLDNITRAEFAQIFYNIIGTYIVSKGTYDKDIKGSVLIRTDDVTFKNMTVDGDLIIGCGAADGKITLDNVTIKGRLLVWGGGVQAVYCNNGTSTPEVIAARVDDAVKIIFDRDSTLAVIDTIKARITERAKQNKETEIIFYGSWSKADDTQHKRTKSCSACGDSTTEYADHVDANGDGKCDDCGATVSLTVTWDAGSNGGTIDGKASIFTTGKPNATATAPTSMPVKTGHAFKGWYTSASGGSL